MSASADQGADGIGVGCVYCEGRWPYRDSLFENAHWSLRRLDGPPGWAVLWLCRHAEKITELTPDELASLGPALADATAAVERAAGVPRVYLTVFGEANPHFHVAVVARADDVPADARGPAIFLNQARLARDGTREAAVAETMRTLLGEATEAR